MHSNSMITKNDSKKPLKSCLEGFCNKLYKEYVTLFKIGNVIYIVLKLVLGHL